MFDALTSSRRRSEPPEGAAFAYLLNKKLAVGLNRRLNGKCG
jgi:hypothetical protein